ncbi:hypothetical protein [Micromonospora sp. NPDC050276]|uniref:hypothetical protein n=1 Tax=Micromonospora sp. NPDC050276 TaxID=3364278 RepID=UPI0037B966CC
MTRIGRLGVAVVTAAMMLLGLSNSAHAVPRSPVGEIASTTGGLGVIGKAPDEIGSGAASGSTETGLAAAVAAPFTCQVNSPSSSGSFQWDTGSPAMLTGIVWTGGGSASCTVPMLSITYNVFAVDPQGISHPIATGSCAGCPLVTAIPTGYTCFQGTTIATNCAGVWQVGYQAVLTATPGNTFSSGSGS